MKKSTLPLILISCVFLCSCIENPASVAESYKPSVKAYKEDKLVSISVHIEKNIDYLNVLRQGVNTGKEPIVYGEIENIAEIIPKNVRSAIFNDRHFSMEWERYRYRIRYRINGKYEFSQWSEAESVASVWDYGPPPDGLNYITKNTGAINMAYRDNEKLTLKEIKERYAPGENSGDGEPFLMSQFQSTFGNIYIDEKTYSDGYVPCLAFSYNDREGKSEKVSRIFDINTLVFKNTGDEVEDYPLYVAADFNLSSLVSPDFFNKDVLLEGFVGEKITDNDEDSYITIEWTSLTPVCLYEPKRGDDRKTDEAMGEAYYKYEKMPVDKEGYSIIKVKSSSQSGNNHDYSNYEGVEGNGRALNKNNLSFYKDFSTYCSD